MTVDVSGFGFGRFLPSALECEEVNECLRRCRERWIEGWMVAEW